MWGLRCKAAYHLLLAYVNRLFQAQSSGTAVEAGSWLPQLVHLPHVTVFLGSDVHNLVGSEAKALKKLDKPSLPMQTMLLQSKSQFTYASTWHWNTEWPHHEHPSPTPELWTTEPFLAEAEAPQACHELDVEPFHLQLHKFSEPGQPIAMATHARSVLQEPSPTIVLRCNSASLMCCRVEECHALSRLSLAGWAWQRPIFTILNSLVQKTGQEY